MQAPLCGTAELGLGEGDQFGDGVEVAECGGGLAEGELEFGAADALGVVDVELAGAEAELLAGRGEDAVEGVGGERVVEKGDLDLVRLRTREGVGGEHGGELRAGADHDVCLGVGGLAQAGVECCFEALPERGLAERGAEEDVAALDVGAGGGEAELAAEGDEVAHGEDAGAADVDAAEQSDEEGWVRCVGMGSGAFRHRGDEGGGG